MASHTAALFAGLLLLQGAVLGFGADAGVKDAATADVDLLMDDILAGIATYVADHNLTVIKLPDVQQKFSFSMWLLTLSGNINLEQGTLRNFQDVARNGDTTINFIKEKRQLVIRMGVQLKKLEGQYNFKSKTGVVEQKGKVDVTVSGTKASIMLNMFMDTLKPTVVELKIQDLGKIGVRIRDGFFGWVASGVANVVVASMRRTIKDTLEQKLPAVINELLDKLDIPDMIKPQVQRIGLR